MVRAPDGDWAAYCHAGPRLAQFQFTTGGTPPYGAAMSDSDLGGLSRRAVLGSAALGVGGIALAGCGSSDSSSKSTKGTPAEAAKPKRGGTFRFGLLDSSSGDSLDVTFGDNTYTNVARCLALNDTLLRRDTSQAKLVPHLAESFEPAKDLSYWDVRLKDAEFHNGKPVTADDVIFSIKRALNPKAPSSIAGILGSIDTKRLKKMDAKTVRINLNMPDISIDQPFTFGASSIVPVDYDPKKPIGSGPFKFKSFTPGRESVFVRNENYFIDGRPYLDELVMTGFADPEATRLGALTSGQIDFADHVAFNQVPTLDKSSNVNVIVSESLGYLYWGMRMDVAPFKDPRVRKAIMLLADRQQIVDQAFSGERFATIANDLPSKQDPLYASGIAQRTQDIEQAKSLLKQAGQSDLRVELAVSPGLSPGVLETAQVLAQQAKSAGVTIKVNSMTDTGTYYTKYYEQAPFKVDYYPTETLFAHIGYSLLPDASYNITNFRDEEFVKLVTEGRGTPDLAKRKEIMAEAQQIMWERGTQAIFNYFHTTDAHSKKFTGLKPNIWGYGASNLIFDEVGLA
jgi:peptide/nickel transport system substrate-binding protein